MFRRVSIQTILWPFLSGLLLVSCGDFQDPATGSQGTILSHPSVSQTPQQPIGENGSPLTPSTSGDVVDPADVLPPADGSTAEPFFPPPQSGNTQLSTGGGDNMPPWLSREGRQPEPLRSENRPQTRTVTFIWSPSSSGNVAGYRAYITALSTSVRQTIDAGSEPQVTVDLPIGERYDLTVTAYNAAGESPPASPIQFDLF
jgi:hypothetical protein